MSVQVSRRALYGLGRKVRARTVQNHPPWVKPRIREELT